MHYSQQCWSQVLFYLPKCLFRYYHFFSYIYISLCSAEMHLWSSLVRYNNHIIANCPQCVGEKIEVPVVNWQALG